MHNPVFIEDNVRKAAANSGGFVVPSRSAPIDLKVLQSLPDSHGVLQPRGFFFANKSPNPTGHG